MDWKKDYNAAMQYAKAADGFLENKKVDNETLYNIISLSIENYAAALASFFNFIPKHYGFSHVFRELAAHCPVPEHFTHEIRFINRFMVYCSLEYETIHIKNEDIKRLSSFMNQMGDYSKGILFAS